MYVIKLVGFRTYYAGMKFSSSTGTIVPVWSTPSADEPGPVVIFCTPPNDVVEELDRRGFAVRIVEASL